MSLNKIDYEATKNIPIPLGVGQTWQGVTGSRFRNTNYTNTSGRPIFISVLCAGSGTPEATLSVGGLVVDRLDDSNAQTNKALQAVIPNGAVYRVDSSGTLTFWVELS